MNKQYKVSRICIACDYREDTLECGKTLEIDVCPECNGAFVDKFYYGKHITKKYIQTFNEVQKDKPLLTIELQDMNSDPIVKYKGEEIKLKTHVAFDWKGRTEESFWGAEFEIEHHLREGEGIGHFNTIKKVSTFKG